MTLYRAGGEGGGKQEMGRLREAHSYGEQAGREEGCRCEKDTLGLGPEAGGEGGSVMQDGGLRGRGRRALARPRRLI